MTEFIEFKTFEIFTLISVIQDSDLKLKHYNLKVTV